MAEMAVWKFLPRGCRNAKVVQARCSLCRRAATSGRFRAKKAVVAKEADGGEDLEAAKKMSSSRQ